MEATQYETIQAAWSKAPRRGLITLGEGKGRASLNAFGPNSFSGNVKEMQKSYSSPTGEIILFREPSTAESILIASYSGKSAEPDIFDGGRGGLQLGYIVRTDEGIFANPPKNGRGEPITDKKVLKSFLNRTKSIKVGAGRIYLVPNAENLRDFGYAEYRTFVQGEQDDNIFVQGGLARILEHTLENPVKNLGVIAYNHPERIKVSGFGKVSEPVLRVTNLHSGVLDDEGKLCFDGDCADIDFGYAFGVLNSSKSPAQKRDK